MPLLLDDLELKSTKAKNVTPKFFHADLTGTGGKAGLLNDSLTPSAPQTATASGRLELKATATQHDISTISAPLAELTRRSIETVETATLPTPGVDDRFVVETDSDDWDVVFDMTPQALVLRKDASKKPMTRELAIQYRTQLCILRAGHIEPERVTPLSPTTNLAALNAAMVVDFDEDPITNAADAITLALGRIGLSVTNIDDLDAWLQQYPVAERITRLAESWSEGGISEEICTFISDLAAAGDPEKDALNALAVQLRYLENYPIPLESYRSIHETLERSFEPDVAETLAKQNFNLLLNHELFALDKLKPQLTTPAAPNPAHIPAAFLSKQQVAAICTHEPLVMVQAGAGTGKTFAIIERISYLEKCGVRPEDIAVVSFTNAAANNITERNPNVGSMTIAAMINDIYRLNHPTHDISSIETIVNSLDIFFPNDQVAATFRQRLVDVDKKRVGASTALNTYVEAHYEQVMRFLDTIKQTSLELEIIVCYQRIDLMIEPANVQCRYLIIDEVQDNSVFEFVYALRYASKHHLSLFIVGDASQTLFEFRSADPRALNTLEGSGVFETFKLMTNYRSNQEILDFANVVLGDLETNQFAGIQLQSDSLDPVTPETFKEKVTLRHHSVPKVEGFMKDTFGPLFVNTVLPDYVEGCLERGEQVAFLAYSRNDVSLMQTALEAKYPNKVVASLVSEKAYPVDVFSKYIKFYWNDVLQVPPNNATLIITRGIRDNLEGLVRNSGNPTVERIYNELVSKWWTQNAESINGWVTLTDQGSMSYDEFYSRLRDNLLTFEINQNAVKKSLTEARNRSRKEKNLEAKADLVVSTIHGAKGLEFDNAVVVHKDTKDMTQQMRRLYYVAFTRAKKSEYIFSWGTQDQPPILSAYEAIDNLLVKQREEAAEKERRARAQALGIDPDLLDEPATDQDENAAAMATSA